ncbi:uncharacterized protein LOC135804492 [Sycon ciliatum]|uniref:uncharacterized protein LOC135804492 n=1 Tax=Sycon ciliatum TaxID=27933 RepID=UPI0031F676A1
MARLLTDWGNPFLGDGIVSLSSRICATSSLQQDLLRAFDVGNTAVQRFITERVTSSNVPFFNPLPAHKLLTYSTKEKPQSKSKSNAQAVQDDRQLFTKLAIMAKHREVNARELVEYQLGSVPWAIANADGTRVSTVKSKLLMELEKDTPLLETVPGQGAILVDGMALLQSITTIPATFGELSTLIFDRLITTMAKFAAVRVDFVCDQYPELSIKGQERASSSTKNVPLRLQAERSEQPTPRQWKRYLSDGQNKMTLISFISRDWRASETLPKKLKCGQKVILTVKKDCFQFTAPAPGTSLFTVAAVPELTCSHEEADTRLLLHAAHVIFKTRRQQRARLVDINAIAEALGSSTCRAFIGVHSFSGCDSASAFVGKGKRAGLELVKKTAQACETMQHLGQDFSLSNDLEKSCEAFTCLLYGDSSTRDVGSVRYNMLCKNTTTPQRMPPSSAALRQPFKKGKLSSCCLVARPPARTRNRIARWKRLATGHRWNILTGIE